MATKSNIACDLVTLFQLRASVEHVRAYGMEKSVHSTNCIASMRSNRSPTKAGTGLAMPRYTAMSGDTNTYIVYLSVRTNISPMSQQTNVSDTHTAQDSTSQQPSQPTEQPTPAIYQNYYGIFETFWQPKHKLISNNLSFNINWNFIIFCCLCSTRKSAALCVCVRALWRWRFMCVHTSEISYTRMYAKARECVQFTIFPHLFLYVVDCVVLFIYFRQQDSCCSHFSRSHTYRTDIVGAADVDFLRPPFFFTLLSPIPLQNAYITYFWLVSMLRSFTENVRLRCQVAKSKINYK